MILGKLKILVNDPKLWEAFKEFVAEEIALQHKSMESYQKTEDFYRAQGAITLLRKFEHLRDKVNAADMERQGSLFSR